MPFPPLTTKLQLDEKWSFVGEKQRSCHPEADEIDFERGDQWDFVSLEPDGRLVLSVLVGKRLLDNAVLLLLDVRGRLVSPPELITSGEWPGYPDAIAQAFGEVVTPERTGRPGRPVGPRGEVPEGVNHATVHKTREGGRVVKVKARIARCAAETATTSAGRSARSGRRSGRHRPRTPAMVAGLTDHVWTLREWITFPACQSE